MSWFESIYAIAKLVFVNYSCEQASLQSVSRTLAFNEHRINFSNILLLILEGQLLKIRVKESISEPGHTRRKKHVLLCKPIPLWLW